MTIPFPDLTDELHRIYESGQLFQLQVGRPTGLVVFPRTFDWTPRGIKISGWWLMGVGLSLQPRPGSHDES